MRAVGAATYRCVRHRGDEHGGRAVRERVAGRRRCGAALAYDAEAARGRRGRAEAGPAAGRAEAGRVGCRGPAREAAGPPTARAGIRHGNPRRQRQQPPGHGVVVDPGGRLRDAEGSRGAGQRPQQDPERSWSCSAMGPTCTSSSDPCWSSRTSRRLRLTSRSASSTYPQSYESLSAGLLCGFIRQLTVPSCCCADLVRVAILQEENGSSAQRLGREVKQQGIGIFDKQLKQDGFVWAIDSTVTGRFVIEIEFLDLKVADPSDHDAEV